MELKASHPFINKYEDIVSAYRPLFDKAAFPRVLFENQACAYFLNIGSLVVGGCLFGYYMHNPLVNELPQFLDLGLAILLAASPIFILLFSSYAVDYWKARQWRRFEEEFTEHDFQWMATYLRDLHKQDPWSAHMETSYIFGLMNQKPNQVALSLISDDAEARSNALFYCFWHPSKGESLPAVSDHSYWASVSAVRSYIDREQANKNKQQKLASFEPLESY